MPTLYSYCIPVDDGAAPNPYWGVCTLAICKPVIRRNARVGDWVVGTGSKKQGLQNMIVYAMKITKMLTLEAYNDFCLSMLPNKIPQVTHQDLSMRAGDCIYYYQNKRWMQRNGVHDKGNLKKDTKGRNALLSEHFYYFGDEAIDLPEALYPIVKQGQGHKSGSNSPYKESFIEWIENSEETKPYLNQLKGQPKHLKQIFENMNTKYSASCRQVCSTEDEACSHKH